VGGRVVRAWLHRVWVLFAAGATVIVVVYSIPGRAGAVAASAAILGATAIVSASTARAVRRALPSDPSVFDVRARRTAPEERRLPDLQRVERLLGSSQATALDLHHRLRPRLRALAEVRLDEGRRISLDTEPERAREALGDAAWELLRPDRPEPADRSARGATLSEIRAVVEALEKL
jgi:hypothetical protein